MIVWLKKPLTQTSQCFKKMRYVVRSRRNYKQKEKIFVDCSLCLKLNLPTLFVVISKLNTQTDLKGQHNFIMLFFVYMWGTLPSF